MLYGSLDISRNMFGIPYNTDELRKGEFWALDDVSFSIKKGEAIGILGQNGSGKTTLLRLLCGIFPPDKGEVAVRGRISALIAVGAGFHPLMSGKENIFLNGTILGMSKKQIRKKYDSIVEFADIGDFLQAPVATYSSGMRVRLGFSIAIHAVPEVLLIDEILAVGDVYFQRKCFEKFYEIKEQGTAIILVSHSIHNLERTCERGILMHHGQDRYQGAMRECVKEYMRIVNDRNMQSEDGAYTVGIGNVEFSNVYVYEENGYKNKTDIEYGKNIIVEFDYSFQNKAGNEYQLRASFRSYEGRDIQKFVAHETTFADSTIYDNEKIIDMPKQGHIKLRIKNQRFFPQVMRLDLAIISIRKSYHEGALANAALFTITEPENPRRYFEYGNLTVTDFDYDIAVE